jgi:hypothetical protein
MENLVKMVRNLSGIELSFVPTYETGEVSGFE